MSPKSRELALLIDFSLAGYDILNGAIDYSRQHAPGWSFQFLSPSVESSWKILEENPVDGIIIHATEPWMIERCEALGIPWVNVSSKLEPLPRVSVIPDNLAIGALAAKTCDAMEGMRPALVSMDGLHFARTRSEGFRRTLAGRPEIPAFSLPALGLYRQPEIDWESVETRLTAFLQELEGPSFAFCVNDEAALLAFNMTQRAEKAMPRELSLLGVDNRAEQLGAPFDRISSIEISFYRLSYLAAQMIDLHDPAEGPLPDRIERLQPIGIVHRQSTQNRESKDPVIQRAIHYIDTASPWDPLNVAQLAEKAGCSRRYLEKYFQSAFNCTPKYYLEQNLLVRARKLLASSQLSLSEIVEQTGFSDLRQMNAAFKRHHGTNAAGYRRLYLR